MPRNRRVAIPRAFRGDYSHHGTLHHPLDARVGRINLTVDHFLEGLRTEREAVIPYLLSVLKVLGHEKPDADK